MARCDRNADDAGAAAGSIRMFLCGDLMTGRGIDQILAAPSDPRLLEPCARSALQYVQLAERRCAALARHVGSNYIWGAALERLEQAAPDVRIGNLETAVTRSAAASTDKQIHYRMNPENIGCLVAAGLDCCVLANNHVLDWGRAGLTETLQTLHAAGILTTGAGNGLREASAPAILVLRGGSRVLVYGVALPSSGVPATWRAGRERAGVNWLPDASARSAECLARQIDSTRGPADRVVLSIHWGDNWGYRLSGAQRRFAHELIDRGSVDLVHGHSSHHPRGLEVYRNRLILYGCGDFINDYEGIGGYERFRPELTLMYFPLLDALSGKLTQLRMVPLRRHCFRLEASDAAQSAWLCHTLDRESRAFGTHVWLDTDGTLRVDW